MKTKIMAILTALLMVGFVSADPTVIEIDWNTAGTINIDAISSDDFESQFNMFSGNQVFGSFKLTDSDDNPYSYGVDTVTAQVEGAIAGGGFMEFINTRTDSKVSMYGDAGEQSYTYIETSDTAYLNFRTSGNYANLQSCNYGFHASNHFGASGNFLVQHSLNDDTGEVAWIETYGIGTTNIDLMGESTWGKTGSFKFGKGCGCYTNADVSATGTGYFEVGAIADNQIDVDIGLTVFGDGSAGSAKLLAETVRKQENHCILTILSDFKGELEKKLSMFEGKGWLKTHKTINAKISTLSELEEKIKNAETK